MVEELRQPSLVPKRAEADITSEEPHPNDFRMNPAAVNNCDPRYCGRMAVLSNFGTFPTWSPYQGRTMQEAITFRQNNIWSDNRYAGRWAFMPFDTGRQIDSAAWQAAPYGQDLGSTF